MVSLLRQFSHGRGRQSRRGMTIIEVALAGTVTLLVALALSGFSRLQLLFWNDGSGSYDSQIQAQRALQQITRHARSARSVVTVSSGETRLTLQMPLFGTTGRLTVPLQNGQVISYYLSDTTGSTAASGNILWRAVNGTPDTAWSLRNGQGQVQVASDGLQFAYYPPDDPKSVTVTLTTTSTSGGRTKQFPVSQEVLLRNKGN